MWNLAVSKPVPGPELVDAIYALEFEGEAAQQVIEQIEASKAAAVALFESGAVGAIGDPEVHYHVGLSGHANPGHVPTAGYENDTLTVHVVQAAPIATPEAPDPGVPAAPDEKQAQPSPTEDVAPEETEKPTPAQPQGGDTNYPAPAEDAEPRTPPVASEEGAS
jgi:hypothetical protein